MATHGDARNNYNNHPFVGHTAEGDFALCHNGVLFNYEQVQKQEQLPKTKIKTDSYVAVQLIEKYGKADFDTIGKMSEIVNGSFVFTVLTSEEKLYISRWDNPICILHFPKLGIYVYTSTKEIMQMALRGTIFEKQPFETIEVTEGEMISIDKNGIIERSRFVLLLKEADLYLNMMVFSAITACTAVSEKEMITTAIFVSMAVCSVFRKKR